MSVLLRDVTKNIEYALLQLWKNKIKLSIDDRITNLKSRLDHYSKHNVYHKNHPINHSLK